MSVLYRIEINSVIDTGGNVTGIIYNLEINGVDQESKPFYCSSGLALEYSSNNCPVEVGTPSIALFTDLQGQVGISLPVECYVINGVQATDESALFEEIAKIPCFDICCGSSTGVSGGTSDTLEATQIEVRDAIEDTVIKDWEYTGFCVYDSSGDELDPPVRQYREITTDYLGALITEDYVLKQHLTDGTATTYTLQAGEEVKPCNTTSNLDPINITDKLKVDGLTGTLTACTSFDFAWSVNGSGSLSVTNTVTSRTTIYPFSDGLAPFNAVDEGRSALETYTFDATAAIGLYLNTQGCRIVTA